MLVVVAYYRLYAHRTLQDNKMLFHKGGREKKSTETQCCRHLFISVDICVPLRWRDITSSSSSSMVLAFEKYDSVFRFFFWLWYDSKFVCFFFLAHAIFGWKYFVIMIFVVCVAYSLNHMAHSISVVVQYVQ